jgi:D-serine deaminase-like pyridoxal phosphate-dependent protein
MIMTTLAQKIARDYGTPALVIDMDRVERNIARIQKVCDDAGIANRPHIKTHKSPALAKLQIEAGAKGITCQKLGEAEIMADAGIDDILISYNLLGDEKMGRLGALQAKATITVAADNSVVIADLPKAAALSGRELNVVIECDTGRKRAGVETPAEAIALAREVKAAKGLNFAGFMLYPTEDGWADAQRFFDEALAGVPPVETMVRRARRRAGADHRLHGRHAEPEECRLAQGRHRTSLRHLHL